MPGIDLNLIFALITFYFVMYVTPGPNNSMVLASGLKFGFMKTIPHMIGITLGHILQLTLVCLGFGKIFQTYPEIQIVLKFICVLYLLYLSYQLIGAFEGIKNEKARPLKFIEAALFQLFNPKAWTISTAAASGFLKTDSDLFISIFVIATIALIICPLSIAPWAVFGSLIRRHIQNKKLRTFVEYLLATLLFATALFILLET